MTLSRKTLVRLGSCRAAVSPLPLIADNDPLVSESLEAYVAESGRGSRCCLRFCDQRLVFIPADSPERPCSPTRIGKDERSSVIMLTTRTRESGGLIKSEQSK